MEESVGDGRGEDPAAIPALNHARVRRPARVDSGIVGYLPVAVLTIPIAVLLILSAPTSSIPLIPLSRAIVAISLRALLIARRLPTLILVGVAVLILILLIRTVLIRHGVPRFRRESTRRSGSANLEPRTAASMR